MSETALTPQQTFEQQIKDRLREAIGELMPDEMLAEMIRQAIEKQFFETRIIELRWNEKHEEPSWFMQEVQNLIKDEMRQFAKEEVAARREEFAAAIRQVLVEKSPQLLGDVVLSLFAGGLQALRLDLSQEIANRLCQIQQR